MYYGAENTRYITLGCVEKSLQMMCWWAKDPNGVTSSSIILPGFLITYGLQKMESKCRSRKIQLGISIVCIVILLKEHGLFLIKTKVGLSRTAQPKHLSAYFNFHKCHQKLPEKKLMFSDYMMLWMSFYISKYKIKIILDYSLRLKTIT